MEQFENQKVVVTGGAGCIGSRLVTALLDLKARVTVLDDFSTGNEGNLPSHPRLEIVRGSVSDGSLVQQTIRDAVIVFHEAARNIQISLSDPADDCNTNIVGTLQVLLAARQSSSLRRVVYASTDSIYGNSRYLPINEDDAPNTLSPFAASKLAGENYCKAFYESFGVSMTVLRYSNVFGFNKKSDSLFHGVVNRFVQCALSGKPLSIDGDGEQTRDFLFVEDAVEATLLSALSSKADGQIYNVGSGFETTIAQLAKKTIEHAGKNSTLQFTDRKDIDNIRRRVLNIERIRKDLRWTPKHTLEKGLIKTLEAHQERPCRK